MSLPMFLQGLGSIGVFASRAFLPAFVTALLLRFGPHLPWLAGAGLLPEVRGVPSWFTADAALVVLGVLAALELGAERFPEARSVLDGVHAYLKTGMAVLTYLGALSATDRAAVGPMIRHAQAGLTDYLPAFAVGAGVYLACLARDLALGPLSAADEDDDLGVQGLIRWAEDLWGALGPLVLVVFPVLAIAAFAVAAAALAVVERTVASRRERGRVPCGHCGEPLHASAPACPSCGAAVKAPRDVGLLGRPRSSPADPLTLPYRLTAVKRCPVCATRFRGRSVKQTCGACGHRLMDDPRFATAYVAAIDRRVPLACLVGFLLGLVPVVGVIPGVIYYRLTIVAPFRRYIPTGRGLLLRWGVRLATLTLVALQWVPVAGALAVPSMAVINYAAYRGAFRKLALAPGDDLGLRPDV